MLLLPFLFSGCSTFGYLLQASKGQLSLWNHARPIQEVLKDDKVPQKVKSLLARIPEIKDFGEKNSLKATTNYIEYVALNRPAVVWVVSASEKLRFRSKEWSFPIVGKFPFLGWFDLGAAKEFQQELNDEGWDTDLRGAGAYSTLGWFRDPVVSPMIHAGESATGDLVNIVLHESVHATCYIYNQAYFNESLATFVADTLTRQFLLEKHGNESAENTAYLKREASAEVYYKKMRAALETLERVYESSLGDEEKTAKKKDILENLAKDISSPRPITNATLLQYKEYHADLASFEKLFKKFDGRWKDFWRAIHTVDGKAFKETQQKDLDEVLNRLL